MAAAESAAIVRVEADALVCPHELKDFGGVGLWYRSFRQVDDDEVLRLIADPRGGERAGLVTRLRESERPYGGRPEIPRVSVE